MRTPRPPSPATGRRSRSGTGAAVHPLLESALSAMGISDQVPTLRHAAEFSERIVTESRAFLEENVPLDSIPLDVVAVGSIARREASTKSDFDYLIVAHALPPTASQSKDLLQAVEKLRRKFRLGAPGSTGMFGKETSCNSISSGCSSSRAGSGESRENI